MQAAQVNGRVYWSSLEPFNWGHHSERGGGGGGGGGGVVYNNSVIIDKDA